MRDAAKRQEYPPPQGRAFDPDWSPALAALFVVWLAVWCVGAYFFWKEVKPKRVPDPDALKPIRGLTTAAVTVKRDGIISKYIAPKDLLTFDFSGNVTEEWLERVEQDDRLISRDVVSV